ncbi:hypothetical protein [Phyllobacterium salinisoli]|nr:hypothetical protein [Phyllobacterium salinisoli]
MQNQRLFVGSIIIALIAVIAIVSAAQLSGNEPDKNMPPHALDQSN